jgi:nicotinamidase-related amidase
MSGTNVKKLNIKNAVLVVIDMQEKLVAAMEGQEALIAQTEKLIKGFAVLGLPLIFTQQYTKGLGETIEPIKNATADEDGNVNFGYVEKLSYSVTGAPEFNRLLEASGRKQIVVCGIEAHVCVQQSVLDFLEGGYEVFVCADTAASRNKRDKRTALKRMGSAGAVITTMESVLFELIGTAEHPNFKAISKIVK